MYARQLIPPSTQNLLAVQEGVISRAQALGTGLGRRPIERLIRDGTWLRLERGVYATLEPDFRQRAWAGHLLAGDPSAIGGAAALHLLGQLEAPDTISVVIPANRRRDLPLGYTTLHDSAGRLARRRGSLPLVRPEDAILDLAPALTLEAFVGVVTDAVRDRLTTVTRVRRVLETRPSLPRRRAFADVLNDLDGIESTLEYVFRQEVERAHGLPEGRRQFIAGTVRFDVLYEEFGVIVEVDGKRGHLKGRFRDYRRDNAHAVRLLVTLRYGSYDLRGDPCGVAAQLASALAAHGWPDLLTPCPRCG